MFEDVVELKIREYLETLQIQTLRNLCRMLGGKSTDCNSKAKAIDSTCDLFLGKRLPAPPSKRGAPGKQAYVDPKLLQTLNEIRSQFTVNNEPLPKPYFEVNSPERKKSFFEQQVYYGVLEIMPSGYGFVRARNLQPHNEEDVFIPASFIHAYKLRQGDFVSCTVLPRQKNESAAIDKLFTVNNVNVGGYEDRPIFESLTPCYPNEKFELSKSNGRLSLRILDLFAPIGKGQRGLIIAPPKAGKTTLLKEIAQALSGRDELKLITLLIDERPEEVTDFRETVDGADLISSTFDESAEQHVRIAEIAIERAKRMAEQGKDVVLLLDSLTKLTRAYNNTVQSSGRTLTGGLDAGAFIQPKRFFGTARNLVGAGSITILATVLVETGSRMDDIIYEEFKGTGNADIYLSRELAQRRVFPAIDIRRSGTRKEELLLSKEELAGVEQLRKKGLAFDTEEIIELMNKTQDNGQFLARLGEWLKIYQAK